MRSILNVMILVLACGFTLPPSQGWAQHKLVRVHVKTQAQFDRLAPLHLDIASSLHGSHVDVVVDSGDMHRIALLGFKSDVLIQDVESEMASLGDGLGDYHTYSEMTEELMAASERYPEIARVDSIGRSYLDRAIWAIKISDRPWMNEPVEADILFVGLHHAREVVTPDVLLYLMHHLLDNYGIDPHITHLVDDREIWIVPVLNPDGHVHVEQGNVMWRKNRRPSPFGTCANFGVDLNRNYGFMWGIDDVGSSGDPCSINYRGAGPFSEYETQAIRDLVLDDANNFTTAVSYHSYGDLILFPWGYTNELTPDHDTYAALGDSMAAYNGYRAGPGYSTIYTTNGDMDDWMYGDMVVSQALDPKHPDNDKHRIFSFTFEVGVVTFKPSEGMIPQLVRENLKPNLFIIEYGDDPYKVWPPDAPEMEDPVRLADGGWELRWRTPSLEPPNAPVAFELEKAAGTKLTKDDFESGMDFWQGSGFTLSQDKSYSGSYSLHAGGERDHRAILEPIYPLHPAPGDSLALRCWYSLPLADNFFIEASDDGGETFTLLPGLRALPGDDPRPFGGILTGDSKGWASVHLPLDSYAGVEILLRFRCSTSSMEPRVGIYIDDVGPILKYRERHILEEQLASGVYRLEAPPEGAIFRARSVDADGQRSRWSSPATVTAFEGVLRRLTVTPNPISSTARICYVAYEGNNGSETVPVRLEVFDAAGRLVRTLFRGSVQGHRVHEEAWNGLSDDGSLLPSGVYFVVLTVRNDSVADKVMLISGF